jgi:choline dehydrogenase-like flavoprotein
LACTRIRRETFDVFGENGDVTAIVAFDQRRENPVTVVTEAAHSLSGESVMEGVSQRDSIGTYWHQARTAKMGRDPMSVVDGNLKVYGIDNLRIADESIMPRVTTGNTMAPCVIIGERAGEVLKAEHKL